MYMYEYVCLLALNKLMICRAINTEKKTPGLELTVEQQTVCSIIASGTAGSAVL
jgi:hypothetical protein